VHPHIGDKSVADITVEDVLGVLTPLWSSMPETATQLRSRIELVLDWARVRGLRTSENCARWRGHLSHLLPKRSKVARVKHFNALPYQQMPAFVAELRERDEVAAKCLRFVILTACRSAEAVMATLDEFDLEARVWTVPAERTKANRVHRIPLTDAAIALLAPGTGYVFTGPRGSHIALASMRHLLQRMGRADITPHGMRSAFRDWAGNETNFPRELAEAALSHVVGDEAERAYRRGDALERRRALMQSWANFCTGHGAEVVQLRA
jgi:integrase